MCERESKLLDHAMAHAVAAVSSAEGTFDELLRSRVSIDEELARSERAVFSPLVHVMQRPDAEEVRKIEAWLQPYRELHSLRMEVWRSAAVATYASSRIRSSSTQQRAKALLELLPPRNRMLSTRELAVAYASELF